MAVSAPTLSVIAVNYASTDALVELVASLRAAEPAPHEILVVDNASPDDSLATLRALQGITLIESPRNAGFGSGCNLGAARATGDLLVFANPDVVVERDSLAILAAHLQERPATAVSFPGMEAEGEAPHERREQIDEIATMAGALMVIRREVFEALGGFDERIFLYWEDTDLCWRAWLAGHGVIKDWASVVSHEAHGSGGGRQWSGEQVRNGLYVHLKLRPWRAVAAFAARMAVKSVVRGVRLRDASPLRAWPDNARRLPETLRARRAVLSTTTPERRAQLEQLCRDHDHWRRFYYRQELREAVRSRLGASGSSPGR